MSTRTRYISDEEVDRYCDLPLMGRLNDRGGLMKCVPGAVVDTIIEATAEIARMDSLKKEVAVLAKSLEMACVRLSVSYPERSGDGWQEWYRQDVLRNWEGIV